MVFNTAYGQIENLPFDIRGHRGLPFAQQQEQPTTEPSRPNASLEQALRGALVEVINRAPAKPRFVEDLSPDQLRRFRDVETIEKAFSLVHLPTLDLHIETIPERVQKEVLSYWDSLASFVQSSLFYLNDTKLRTLFGQFLDAFRRTVDCDQYQDMGHLSHCVYIGERKGGEWKDLKRAALDLPNALSALLSDIRDRYPEVDIAAASRRAWAVRNS